MLDGGPFELLFPVWMWGRRTRTGPTGGVVLLLEGCPPISQGVRYLGGQVQYFLRARWISRVPGNAPVPSQWGVHQQQECKFMQVQHMLPGSFTHSARRQHCVFTSQQGSQQY